MKFTPTPELLAIDPEWRERWATALETSVQGLRSLCRPDGSMCCLGVLEHLYGRPKEEMVGRLMPLHLPNPVRTPCGQLPEMIPIATDEDGVSRHPSSLNDHYLTHPQIAQLLRGHEIHTDT